MNLKVECRKSGNTATATENSVAVATKTRESVTRFLPLGESPILSTSKDAEVCPATVLIVKRATPICGTVMLWTDTKNPPITPAIASQYRSLLCLSARKIVNSPSRSFFKPKTKTKRMTQPVVNEISAAARPL